MQKNISPVNFEARLMFTMDNNLNKPSQRSSMKRFAKVLHTEKTKEPSWLLKLFFGIKKKTKLPTIKTQ